MSKKKIKPLKIANGIIMTDGFVQEGASGDDELDELNIENSRCCKELFKQSIGPTWKILAAILNLGGALLLIGGAVLFLTAVARFYITGNSTDSGFLIAYAVGALAIGRFLRMDPYRFESAGVLAMMLLMAFVMMAMM